MERVPERHLFIDGAFVPPVRGGRLPVICPFTEQPIGSIPAATAEDVDAAVGAAAAAVAARQWTVSSGADRARFLRAIADKVKERKAQLARLETLDMGKPIAESEWDMDDVAGCFEYYAGGPRGGACMQGQRCGRVGKERAWDWPPPTSLQHGWLPANRGALCGRSLSPVAAPSSLQRPTARPGGAAGQAAGRGRGPGL